MVALKSTAPVRRIPSQQPLHLTPKQRIAPVRVAPTPARVLSRTNRQKALVAETLDARVVPSAPEMPAWLRSLVGVERTAGVLALLLGTATLAVYGSSVYSQQQWGTMYNRFQTLERNERELSVTGEMLKDKMAERAFYSDTQLVPQNPGNTIFLDPTPQSAPPRSPSVRETTANTSATPLGY